MKRDFLYKNGFVYAINIGLFTLLYIQKPNGATYMVGVLIILLLFAFFALKQTYVKHHIVRIKEWGNLSVNAGILFLLFGFLTILHWKEYALIEKGYLLLFCLVQALLLKVPDASVVDE